MKRLPAIALLGLVVAGLIAAHFEALAGMVRVWHRSPMYSYAFTVPLISGYLLWTRRHEFAALQPRPSLLFGGGTLAMGLAMLLVGHVAGIQLLQQLAFLVSLAASVLLLFGVDYLRTGAGALAYLLLMIPFWDAFTDRLHWPFQNQSAVIGMAVMQLVGVPVHREGILLALPNVTLEVARACSGVNYLIAVVALGLPLAYLNLASTWRRVLLVAAAVAVAALSNGLRVALIGVLAYFEVGSPLHGPFHVLHGLFVAAAGYVVLFAGLHFLREPDVARPADSSARARSSSMWNINRRGAIAVAAVFLSAAVLSAGSLQPVPLQADLTTLPVQLGSWTAQSPGADTAMPWSAGADAQLVRRYRAPDGAAADVYVGYIGAQSQGREIVSYRNADMHRRANRSSIAVASGPPIAANIVPASEKAPDALFWYEIDGDVETSQLGAKLRTAWNGIRHARTNGAIVAVTGRPGSETPDPAQLKELAGLVHDALGACLPRVRRS